MNITLFDYIQVWVDRTKNCIITTQKELSNEESDDDRGDMGKAYTYTHETPRSVSQDIVDYAICDSLTPAPLWRYAFHRLTKPQVSQCDLGSMLFLPALLLL